jgi:hypothetical protein
MKCKPRFLPNNLNTLIVHQTGPNENFSARNLFRGIYGKIWVKKVFIFYLGSLNP